MIRITENINQIKTQKNLDYKLTKYRIEYIRFQQTSFPLKY